MSTRQRVEGKNFAAYNQIFSSSKYLGRYQTNANSLSRCALFLNHELQKYATGPHVNRHGLRLGREEGSILIPTYVHLSQGSHRTRSTPLSKDHAWRMSQSWMTMHHLDQVA